MRDAVALNRKGIPTVTVSFETFEDEARAAAKLLRVPKLRIANIPVAWNEDDFLKAADVALDKVATLLTFKGANLTRL